MGETIAEIRFYLRVDAFTQLLREGLVRDSNQSDLTQREFITRSRLLLRQLVNGTVDLNRSQVQLFQGMTDMDGLLIEDYFPAVAETITGDVLFAKGVARELENESFFVQRSRVLPSVLKLLSE